jgi:hypothetical protein
VAHTLRCSTANPNPELAMPRRFVRLAAVALFATPLTLAAQSSVRGGVITPYAGYLIAGRWYDGPIGANVAPANTPLVGAQLTVPITRGLSLVGSLGYASGDVRVGLPVLGGINVGENRLLVYDGGLELGGHSRGGVGIAPFVQVGVGGITNTIRSAFLTTQSTNLVYTGGVGIDVALARAVGVRVMAKDHVGRFDTQEAIGIASRGNLSHHWALSAGLKLAF